MFKYSSPKESSGFLLWKISNLWQKEIRNILSPFNLTHTQFVVLANIFWLTQNKYDVTQIQISKQSGVGKMMISSIIKILKKKNFIIVTQSITDNRAKVISLTETGEKLLKKTVPLVESFDDYFFKKLWDQRSFNNELSKLLAR